MLFLKFTDDKVVKRLSWIMSGTIIFSIINTLLGQPDVYWNNPAMAIRGDGLSIYNSTNYTINFFLGYDWVAYIIVYLIFVDSSIFNSLYITTTPCNYNRVVFIFGYFFGATN